MMNKDEADRCIEIAERYISEKNRRQAEKFLHKAERLCPSQRAKDLLSTVSLMPQSASEAEKPKAKAQPKVEKPEAPQYTAEQKEAVERVRKCKDYYEILGVSKDATDSDIKKAYKKLALQLHPDKNKCPGAAEAFKVIGNVHSVLTDAEKRKQYDLHGTDEERIGRRGGHYSAYNAYQAEATPDELFNMFFGSGFGGGNIYVRRGGRWQRQQTGGGGGGHEEHTTHHREHNQNSYTMLFQLLPILLAVLLSMASSIFIADPAYSLQESVKYPVIRKTQNLGVDYYVKESFHTDYQGSLRRLEATIEEEFVANLRHACYREKNYRDSMIWKARNFGDRDLYQTAQNIRMPSCEKLQQIRNHG